MEKLCFLGNVIHSRLLSIITIILYSYFLPLKSYSQQLRPVQSEIVTCEIKVSSKEIINSTSKVRGLLKRNSKTVGRIKSYRPGINQLGYFNQVSNIQPAQKVPVQVCYPNAHPGDKVVIAVADGGTLENNSKVQIGQLDDDRKLSFNFIAGMDKGIYRIFLRKQNDTKVVQLWVGEETLPIMQSSIKLLLKK